jgi:hypothetical protein
MNLNNNFQLCKVLQLNTLNALQQGCQIILGTRYRNRQNIPNEHKIYQYGHKISQMSVNITDGHKIYQHFRIHGPK